MARSVTVRLSDAQAERLERFARDRNADIAEAGVRLIDEALRGAEHTVIEFRDSAVGRQAYLRGSSLAAWEVAMLARERAGDVAMTAAYLGWPVARVEAALRYANAYRDEIDTVIQENEDFDAEALRRLLPDARVIDIDVADAS